MSFEISEFNTFCQEANMDFEISEKLNFKPVEEIKMPKNRHYFNARRRENRISKIAQEVVIASSDYVEEYPCDKCDQHPAQTWDDDMGAICYGCRNQFCK